MVVIYNTTSLLVIVKTSMKILKTFYSTLCYLNLYLSNWSIIVNSLTNQSSLKILISSRNMTYRQTGIIFKKTLKGRETYDVHKNYHIFKTSQPSIHLCPKFSHSFDLRGPILNEPSPYLLQQTTEQQSFVQVTSHSN